MSTGGAQERVGYAALQKRSGQRFIEFLSVEGETLEKPEETMPSDFFCFFFFTCRILQLVVLRRSRKQRWDSSRK